jgi:MFS family permease
MVSPLIAGQIADRWFETQRFLPAVYRRLGAKRTIALGILAWGLRFAVLSMERPVELMIAAQTLHGFCFSFVSAAAMIYVERICPPDIRHSAQSLLNWMTYGAGLFAGFWLGGAVADRAAAGGGLDWAFFWRVPAIGCAAVLTMAAPG